MFRKRIFEIIEIGEENDRISRAYDIFMMATIILSIFTLMTRAENTLTFLLDKGTMVIFILDYLLRFITADFKIKRGAASFALYPFSPLAIIDLVSILPSLSIINRGFRILKVVRLIRTFRIFRIFKAFRYSKNIRIIVNVFKKQRDSLLVVCGLAIGYVFVTALIMYNIEPETFETIFDAFYWATVSLTTVGYGDLYAVTPIGRAITMFSSFFGIAIVALPAGIITAGYMEEVTKKARETDPKKN